MDVSNSKNSNWGVFFTITMTNIADGRLPCQERTLNSIHITRLKICKIDKKTINIAQKNNKDCTS